MIVETNLAQSNDLCFCNNAGKDAADKTEISHY